MYFLSSLNRSLPLPIYLCSFQMRIPTNQILTTLAPKTTPTTTTTKKPTTLRTTPRLTTAATRKTSAVLVPKKKKPTSSFDNDKDSNDGTNNSNDTIKACKYKKIHLQITVVEALLALAILENCP